MKKALLIFSCLLALSCNDDDNTADTTGKNSMNLVTGINFRESFENIVLHLGNPNILVNNKFILYPNPAIETIFIKAEENITDIWIVPANAKKIYQEVDFTTALHTNLYSEQSIAENSKLSFNEQSSTEIGVNIGTLKSGYYRVFIKIGGKIYWDNLYKIDDSDNREAEVNALMNSWN